MKDQDTVTRMSLTTLLVCLGFSVSDGREPDWQQPLRVKEQTIERNIRERHNILGLYPSMVEQPRHGGPIDITTSTPFSDVVHSVAWTSHYLAGASYRYAWLVKSEASAAEIEDARRRADELFEAVYRCQRVTGRRGLLARGYLIGSGPTFDERRAASHRDDWHQGEADGYSLRFCAGPSHHIYSAAAMGMGHYFDLVATGKQKERAREAIDALVSYWVDNDYRIAGYDENSRAPFSILGFTDGRSLNARVMMAISAARIAYHVTGKQKFKRAFDDLAERYSLRDFQVFRTNKNYDDTHHVLAHLDLLVRIEDDVELGESYRRVADRIYPFFQNEGHSHFTFIYYHLRPDASGKEAALRNARMTLETWPTDMTIRPVMSSLDPSIKPPYPVHATGWDNEFIWKGSLTRPNANTSRIASNVTVSPRDPNVFAVVDPAGHLYLTHDQARSDLGWKCISDGLPSPVRDAAFGEKTRVIAVACDDGFYLSQTAGDDWIKLGVEIEHPPTAVKFDTQNPRVLYAITRRSIHRSLDYGDELLATAWDDIGRRLPAGRDFRFNIARADHRLLSRVHAISGSDLFSLRDASQPSWQLHSLGLGRYGNACDWLLVDPRDSERWTFGTRYGLGSIPMHTVFQTTSDGGQSWSNQRPRFVRAFYDGSMRELLREFPPHELLDVQFAPGSASEMYSLDGQGVVRIKNVDSDWKPLMTGLEMPRVDRLFCPDVGNRVFASTPGGVFHLNHGENEWKSSHLWMQWRKNERRELGGAAFITAYWRALHFGFIQE